MPAPRLIVRDDEATGPRDAAEYAAYRAAHAALPHPDLRRIADHRRASLILTHYHAAEKRAKAERDLADAKKISGRKADSPEAKDAQAAAKRAAEAAARTLAELDKAPPVPDLAPCSVARCPGHALLSVADLRRAARTIRPLTHAHKEAAAKKRAAAA